MPDTPSLEDLLVEADDIPDAEIQAWLDQRCGDEALKARFLAYVSHRLPGDGTVERAITTDKDKAPRENAESTTAGSVADTPTPRETPAHPDAPLPPSGFGSIPPPDSLLGETLGVFQLEEVIGRGGMGQVYLGRRASGDFEQQVAIKVLQPSDAAGMLPRDEARALADRMEDERQTLAALSHPHIATLLDGGTTPDGWPYLVLEYVDGEPIDTYCDRKKLAIDDRLKLFQIICRAVQFCHQRGVIHRDLKPGNILVTNDGVPKLLDFGISKLMATEMSNRSSRTKRGMFVGTVDYSSPEQVKGEAVTVYFDVYALGVLLYRLLTGLHPLDVRGKPPDERVRIISDDRIEAARPSSLLAAPADGADATDATSRANVDEISRARGTTNERLIAQLAGDIDMIATATVRKLADKRYASAEALADDIDCYFEDRPVWARRGSRSYVIRKFIRRNRGWLISAALLLICLVGGIAGTLWGLFEAREAQSAAEANESAARTAETEAKAARAEADRNAAAATAAKIEAVRKQELAQQRQRRLERLQYINRIQSADEAWVRGDIKTAWRELDAAQWDLRGWEHDFLYSKFTRGQTTLKGHTSGVINVCFSPDGKRVASASEDNTAKVWDVAKGAEVVTLDGHTDVVSCVVFNEDGSQVITASHDKTARVWDAVTGEQLRVLRGHKEAVSSVAFSANSRRIVTGSFDNTAKVWDIATGKVLVTLEGHKDRVRTVDFSPDGRQIVTGSEDKLLKIWDTESGRELRTLRGHRHAVIHAAYRHDGQEILSNSGDESGAEITVHDTEVKFWDPTSGEETDSHEAPGLVCVKMSPNGRDIVECVEHHLKVWPANLPSFILRGHTHQVVSADFSSDGKWIVSGSYDGTVKVWNAVDGQAPPPIWNDQRRFTSARHSWSRDGKWVVGADRNRIEIWDVASRKVVQSVACQTTVVGVAISLDGNWIAGSSEDGTLKIWNTQTGIERVSIPSAGRSDVVVFTPDGGQLWTFFDAAEPRVWNVTSGKEIKDLPHHGRITGDCFSHDGQKLVTCTLSGALLRDVATGANLRYFKSADGAETASISQDGSRILTSNFDNTVDVFDSATGAHVVKILCPGRIESVQISPRNRWIVSQSSHAADVWDLATGRRLFTIPCDSWGAPRISPDGTRILCDNGRRIWDAPRKQETLTLRGHARAVSCASFSFDGSRIVSGGLGGSVRVWDARTGQQLLTLQQSTPIVSAAFNPEGTRIVASTVDSVVILDAANGEELNRFRIHDADPRIADLDGSEAAFLKDDDVKVAMHELDVVSQVTFSPDGQRVVAGIGKFVARPDSIKVLDASSGRDLSMSDADAKLLDVARSSDTSGGRVVSGEGSRLVIRDAVTGRELFSAVDDTEIVPVRFSPNGRRVVSGSWDGTVKVWLQARHSAPTP